MNPFPDPSHAYPGQPPPSGITPLVPQASQFSFQSSNEQILWLHQQQQQQHQRLREQQAAIMQLYYAQQARGFSTEIGTHGGNMNMLSNPFPTALTPFPYGFPSFPSANVSPSSPQLNNISYQYPLSQSLHQPPPPFPPLSLSAIGLSNDDSPTEELAASASASNTPAGWKKSVSAASPLLKSTESEFSAVDDLILAKALHDYNTTTEAISSLEGTRGRSGSVWEEYYTSKRHIIDEVVRELCLSKEFHPTRATNSRQHTPPLGIPTKEPAPSITLVPHNGGNKYTEEDDKYFTQYVLWRFSQNVKATKGDICQALYDKAPHHSFESWKTYWWSRNSDIEHVRKLFKDGTPPQGLTTFEATSSRNPHGRSTRLASPLTQGTRSWSLGNQKDGNQKDKHGAGAFIPVPESESSTSDSSDLSEDDHTGQDVAMRVSTSRSPIPYTKADLQAVAEYMADHPNVLYRILWHGLSKLRPAHTSKAWGEYYRRNQAAIDRKVRHLVIRRKKSADATVMPEDVESRLEAKRDMSDSVARSCSNEPMDQSHLPATPQIVVKHQAGGSPSQPHPQPIDSPSMPTTTPEPASKSQPALSVHNLVAKPHQHSPASVLAVNQSQPRAHQALRDSSHLSRLKPTHKSDDCHIVEPNQGFRPSTSLSAAQWPSEIQTSQIRLTHVQAPLIPLSPPPLHNPTVSKPPPVVLPQSQSTVPQCNWKDMALDPEIPVAGALLAAMKRKATEDVTGREVKKAR